MTNPDPAAKAAALIERGRKARAEIETSEYAIATTTGRALIHLLANGNWPSDAQLLSVLEAVASGKFRLQDVTPGAARAAEAVISNLRRPAAS